MSYYDEAKDIEGSNPRSNAFKDAEKSLKHVTSVSEAVRMGTLDFDALTEEDMERLGVHKVQVEEDKGERKGGVNLRTTTGTGLLRSSAITTTSESHEFALSFFRRRYRSPLAVYLDYRSCILRFTGYCRCLPKQASFYCCEEEQEQGERQDSESHVVRNNVE